MSCELQRFDFGDLPVRVDVDDDGEPWFVLSDVCRAIDISRTNDVASRLKDDEKGTASIRTPGGVQEMTVISEPGLYRTIFRSRKQEADRFQDWVFREVLPEIRRTGHYSMETSSNAQNDTTTPPVAEREVRHPDGRVVIERYDVGHVTHRSVSSEGSILPSSEPESIEPDVPVERLRKRFHRALGAALSGLPEYQKLAKEYRGKFHQKVNRQLKSFIGSERDSWRPIDYTQAVYWLQMEYGLDIEWVLHPVAEGGT